MRIGYACLVLGVPQTDQKSCILKNVNEVNLMDLIAHNLCSLENIIDYNIKNNIRLFRISSGLIPFGSSPANSLPWARLFAPQFLKIGEKIRKEDMRISMHSGHCTVLNSPDENVVRSAIADLNYHVEVLDSLGVDESNKIILHIGGLYGDKKLATRRFITNYRYLNDAVKQRLVLENDDKAYNIDDVLEIGSVLGLPVVFDNLHHEINACGRQKSHLYWIEACGKTWQKKDGCQKIHYSQQDPSKKPGSHSSTIRINEFMAFYEALEGKDLDIMLEVKDKNLSAVKCINCTSAEANIKKLELEWSKYKYKILENDPDAYGEIRRLLSNKHEYPAVAFYNLVEDALKKETTLGNFVNAAQHIWGYFKNTASKKEKDNFMNKLENYEKGTVSARAVKNTLWQMAVKYQQIYLLNSYYFML